MSLRYLNIQYPLFAPEPSGAGVIDKPVGSGKDLTTNEIIDFLGEDDDKAEIIPVKDDKKEDKEDKKDKKEDKEEVEEKTEESKEETEEDELAELEEELEEPDEEKLELTTPTSRREILKKYPKLFKEFPSLEKAYYREMEFTKLLPTIKDAKDAVEKSEILDRFEKDLGSGNTEVILKAVKENNPKAFARIADEYLSTLGKVDKDAYHVVLGNTLKHTIMAMVQEARATKNEPLQEAANILNQFAFGSSNFTPPTKLAAEDKPEEDDKEKKISERERQFTKQRFNTANTELNTKVEKVFKATIEAHIDPKKSMPDYVRKNAVRDAQEELESLISKDSRFKAIIDKLWEKAFEDDFSSESMDKIYRAVKSKAGTLLSSVVKKARNEALRGLNRKTDDDSRPDKNESKNGDESRRRNDSKRGDESHRRNDSSKIPAGMSSYEYLMSDDD